MSGRGPGLGGGGGVRLDVNEELKFFLKIQKQIGRGVESGGGWGRVGEGVGLGGQGRCEQRSEVLVKIKKKTFFFWGGGSGWGGGGVRMEVNEELKLL